MLSSFRRYSNSWVVKILLGLLVFSFVAWGVGDMLFSRSSTTAISVDGTDISAQTLNTAFNRNVQTIQQSLNVPHLGNDMIKTFQIPERTIQNLVSTTLVKNDARRLGLQVSDRHLLETIKQNQQFMDTEGNFSAEKYRAALATVGLTPDVYEADIANTLLLALWSEIFTDGFYNNPAMAEKVAAHYASTLSFKALKLDATNVKANTQVSAEEAQAYYKENQNMFMEPERRSVDVLIVSANNLAEQITISEDDVTAEYTANPQTYSTAEKRRARHILVDSKEQAEQLLEELNKGADFATLAQKHSTDTASKEKGGDLGYFTQNDMIDAFATVAFTMEQGAISPVVETPFGFHIIKMEDIQPSSLKPLSDVRNQIVEKLKLDHANSTYYTMITNIEDALAAGDKLGAIARREGLTVLGFDHIAADGTTPAGAPITLPEDSKNAIINEAFNLAEGDVSPAIDLGNGRTAFVAARQVTMAHPQPFAQIKSEVVNTLAKQKQQQAVLAKAAEVVAAAQKQNGLAAAAALVGNTASPLSFNNVKRNGENAPNWLDSVTLRRIFTLKDGETLPQPVVSDTAAYVVQVVSHRVPQVSDEQKQAMAQQLAGLVGQELRQEYMEYLATRAKVKTRRNVIQQAIPAELFSSNNMF